MDRWMGGLGEMQRTIYIAHLQLVENEQNKREQMCV